MIARNEKRSWRYQKRFSFGLVQQVERKSFVAGLRVSADT